MNLSNPMMKLAVAIAAFAFVTSVSAQTPLCIFKVKFGTGDLCNVDKGTECPEGCKPDNTIPTNRGLEHKYYTGNETREIESGGDWEVDQATKVNCWNKYECEITAAPFKHCGLPLVGYCVIPNPEEGCWECTRGPLIAVPAGENDANFITLKPCTDS